MSNPYGIIRKSFSVPSESVFTTNSDGSVTTVVKFSDGFVDTEGDAISLTAWNFREKTALLAHHDQGTDPIGRVDEAWVDSTGAFAKVTFHPGTFDPRGQKYAEMARFGSMPGVSAGFIVHEAELAEDREEMYRSPLNITKATLLEISFVSVPANERAGVYEKNLSIKKSFLAQSDSKGEIMSDKDNVETLEKDLATFEDNTEQPAAPKEAEEVVQKSNDLESILEKILDGQSEIRSSVEKKVSELFEGLVEKLLTKEEIEEKSASEEQVDHSEVVSSDDVADETIELTEEQFQELVSAHLSGFESAE